MTDVMINVLLLFVIGTAVIYIIIEKKKGRKCIGCPYAGECSKKTPGDCNCQTK